LLKLENLSQNGVATFEISLPAGWKLAKAPDIVSKSNSLDFKYQENFEQISPNKYRTRCNLNKNQQDLLKFDFFVCKDVCTIVNKDFFFTPNDSERLLWLMILFGLIGGLLLNIMPCVLPVILLKIRHMNSRTTIINSIVGNYLSFFILAAVLALLKMSGETIGWGLHFQNIYFLKFTVIIFFILSLISFGKLNFHLNISLDRHKIANKTLRDIFFSMITTLVAIPCTAPLLGTAATFAIQESSVNLFIIFTAIATGFSVPYFIALFGRFSLKKIFQNKILNHFIDFGVVITFAWLCWILFKNINVIEIIVICSVFTLALALLKKRYNLAAMLLLASALFVNIPQKTMSEVDQIEEVLELVKQNNTVILNITADWCLSCKYNKLKLLSDQVQTKIKENNIKFVEIDITRKNDKVMKFIHEHSRVGIPFTVVYGPKNKSGVLLSEIPETSEIIKAIDLVK
jgi:suppressor for copper-sensitivity B